MWHCWPGVTGLHKSVISRRAVSSPLRSGLDSSRHSLKPIQGHRLRLIHLWQAWKANVFGEEKNLSGSINKLLVCIYHHPDVSKNGPDKNQIRCHRMTDSSHSSEPYSIFNSQPKIQNSVPKSFFLYLETSHDNGEILPWKRCIFVHQGREPSPYSHKLLDYSLKFIS